MSHGFVAKNGGVGRSGNGLRGLMQLASAIRLSAGGGGGPVGDAVIDVREGLW